eukprot:scaffold3667_cov110-Isochrysis_galbana.AAC.15
MMTTLLLHPLDALLALLTMASLLTSLAAFILFQDHFAAAGYLVTSATSGVLTRTGRRLRLAVSIAASVPRVCGWRTGGWGKTTRSTSARMRRFVRRMAS